VNDGPTPVDAELQVAAYRGEATVATGATRVRVGPRSADRVRVAALLDHFFDTTYAYRFGAVAHEVTVATLVDATTGAALSEAFHFPRKLPSHPEIDLGVGFQATRVSDELWKATVSARRTAFAVELSLRDFEPDDNYFHLAPGKARVVGLRALRAGARPQGTARPINAQTATKLELKP
jgi:beta-mannosidase